MAWFVFMRVFHVVRGVRLIKSIIFCIDVHVGFTLLNQNWCKRASKQIKKSFKKLLNYMFVKNK